MILLKSLNIPLNTEQCEWTPKNCFSVIKFVKGLQITIMDNPRSDELIQKRKVLLPTLKCQLQGQMKENSSMF